MTTTSTVEPRREPRPIPRGGLALGLLRACRPKQWAKNVLVVVAPAAASAYLSRGPDGIEIHGWAFAQTLLAFVAFSMVASATYLVNDSVDVAADRRHPTKRNRPIAAGIVPIRVAIAAAVVLMIGGLGLGMWRNWQFCVVVAIYAVQTTLYSFWLKNEPVLDVVALSGGFILRLLGGAVALEVEISKWFFIISCFGALFIAVGKRLAEKRELEGRTEGIRRTLGVYTEAYLRFLQAVSAGIVLVGYMQWAFEKAEPDGAAGLAAASGASGPGAVWFLLSILPFLVAILRYGLLVELGEGSAPEELLFSDRQLQVVGLLWAVLVGVGFYVSG